MVDSDVSIVEIDTSVIPLDVLFHLTVHSSAIRFEGQQQVVLFIFTFFYYTGKILRILCICNDFFLTYQVAKFGEIFYEYLQLICHADLAV